ncbi:ABC transporter permease subunit [Pengzhenrongella sp.]|jgi:ABC-2 type transport system permease protein|uniref:ABC transporter permease subunit n=1 Tax=Pengzhenrongella sp. TaxID=2888820 RepID=UPI002F92EBF2
MTTSILTSPTATSPGAASSDEDVRLTFPRIVTSEWIKFRTLRSTLWVLGVTIVLMVGVSVLFAFGLKTALASAPPGSPAPYPGATVITAGYYFGQLAVAVLGVLVISGEYSTGMIRSTLAAVPTRLPALAAKALVLAVSSFVVGIVGVGLSYLATMSLLPANMAPAFGEPETIRIVLGSALYLSAISLLAFALGALLRHSAAALASVFGLLLVLPIVFTLVPGPFTQKVSPFLPAAAGGQLMAPQATIDAMSKAATGTFLGPWQGFAILIAWVVVILAAAVVLLRRRNA